MRALKFIVFFVFLLVCILFVSGWAPHPPEWQNNAQHIEIQHIDIIPGKKFFISKIRTNQLVYDEIKPGDLLFVDLNFENIGRYNTKYATIRVTVPELGISRKLGPFRGPEIDEAMSRGLYLEIPENAKPDVYTARISLSDLKGIRRTRHRDFRIIK